VINYFGVSNEVNMGAKFENFLLWGCTFRQHINLQP